MPDFIRHNPGSLAFQERDRVNRVRAIDDREQAVDTAIRGGLAEQGDLDPVSRRLVATPGGGATALAAQQADSNANHEMEVMAITALGAGEVPAARYWSQRAGLQIPEEYFQSQEAATRFATGSLVANRLYGQQNPNQAAAFLRTYLQSGDGALAFDAAGPVPDRRGGGGGSRQQAQYMIDEMTGFLVSQRTGEFVEQQRGYGVHVDPQTGARTTQPLPGMRYDEDREDVIPDPNYRPPLPQQPQGSAFNLGSLRAPQPYQARPSTQSQPTGGALMSESQFSGARAPQQSYGATEPQGGGTPTGQTDPATGLPIYLSPDGQYEYVVEDEPDERTVSRYGSDRANY